MDVKILAAVLASLAAVFAGMNGGVFSESDVRNVQSTAGLETPEISSQGSNIPFIGQFLERPNPENDLEARIEVDSGSEINLRKSSLEARNLKEISSPGIEINSDEDIKFKTFSGTVKFGNTTKIKGDTSGLESSGLNISTDLKLDTDFDTEQIKVSNTQKINLDFSEADISPLEGSDFPIDTENTKIAVKSFTGDLDVYTQNRTIDLRGQVHRISGGKANFGSE